MSKLLQRGEERLFPELSDNRDGYGHAASKWFARHRVKCGVIEDGKVFHSFRHTFINHLKQSEVSKEKIAQLVGHEDATETFGRYGKAFELNAVLEAVNKLEFKFLIESI